MKVTIKNTTKIVDLDGVAARIWEGKTDSGIPVHCFITRIVADKNENLEQFEEELQEQSVPSPEVEAIPLRLVL